MFDLAWYEQEAGRSFAGLREAVGHYRKQGAARQLSPHPVFEPTTASDPTTGWTPLGAYLTSARGTGRRPTRAGTSGPTSAASPAQHDTSTVRSATSRSGSPTRRCSISAA